MPKIEEILFGLCLLVNIVVLVIASLRIFNIFPTPEYVVVVLSIVSLTFCISSFFFWMHRIKNQP